MIALILRAIERLNVVFSRHGGGEFFSPNQFPWVQSIESQTHTINKELEFVMENVEVPNFQDVSEEQYTITNDDKWKTYVLYAYGHRVEANCKRCLATDAILKTIPGIKTAMFSILAPGKEIPPHRGPYNGVLRYHLGLKVPEGDKVCGIKVGDEVRYWQPGKSLVFDDSYEHSAWNHSDKQRVILFVDFERPVYFPMRWLNRLMIGFIGRSGFVQNAIRNAGRYQD